MDEGCALKQMLAANCEPIPTPTCFVISPDHITHEPLDFNCDDHKLIVIRRKANSRALDPSNNNSLTSGGLSVTAGATPSHANTQTSLGNSRSRSGFNVAHVIGSISDGEDAEQECLRGGLLLFQRAHQRDTSEDDDEVLEPLDPGFRTTRKGLMFPPADAFDSGNSFLSLPLHVVGQLDHLIINQNNKSSTDSPKASSPPVDLRFVDFLSDPDTMLAKPFGVSHGADQPLSFGWEEGSGSDELINRSRTQELPLNSRSQQQGLQADTMVSGSGLALHVDLLSEVCGERKSPTFLSALNSESASPNGKRTTTLLRRKQPANKSCESNLTTPIQPTSKSPPLRQSSCHQQSPTSAFAVTPSAAEIDQALSHLSPSDLGRLVSHLSDIMTPSFSDPLSCGMGCGGGQPSLSTTFIESYGNSTTNVAEVSTPEEARAILGKLARTAGAIYPPLTLPLCCHHTDDLSTALSQNVQHERLSSFSAMRLAEPYTDSEDFFEVPSLTLIV
eukprot:GILJ01018282.1.p1 GENE.GILJ01018282.1~~GILJ01018282.1.p1  ORF type:complete len:503 (+),score=33.38 GILJ01018282.1:486-1994(+)